MPTPLPETASIEEIRRFFEGDRFATQTVGCRIVSASRGHAVCELDVTDAHRNAPGGVMGGAVFTLADFALAVACSIGEDPTVTVTSTIEFMSGAKGTRLTAVCDADKSGRHLGFYTTDVTDETGRHLARVTATCYR